MKSVGQILLSERKLRNLSINDISIELKISQNTIFDIENNNIKNNSDIIFNIGHLRTYSNYLGLDADIIIRQFKNELSFNNNNKKRAITPIVDSKFFKIEKYFAFSLILIIFISFYFLFINTDKNEINYALVPDISKSLEPIVEKAYTNDNNLSKNNSSAVASIEINENVNTIATLKMLNSTWLQLRDPSDNIIFSKLMEKDEEFSYELKMNYNITTGNAGNILVLIDGDVRGKIGKYGDILDSFVLYKDFSN